MDGHPPDEPAIASEQPLRIVCYCAWAAPVLIAMAKPFASTRTMADLALAPVWLMLLAGIAYFTAVLLGIAGNRTILLAIPAMMLAGLGLAGWCGIQSAVTIALALALLAGYALSRGTASAAALDHPGMAVRLGLIVLHAVLPLAAVAILAGGGLVAAHLASHDSLGDACLPGLWILAPAVLCALAHAWVESALRARARRRLATGADGSDGAG
jgi:hypothetical protein